ncbi:MAG: SGNH/GDSL hydrolase family protein [Deltaproteobacteria bacterium]|nr:SGNH/GDSL hydrolase family protein [Deltaproteobacteria bacterium]MBW2533095.1 SGNH/GDSL hydrolase family protein [Deltaproteobacteria bacterium]
MESCWGFKGDDMGPDYDQFQPVVGSHCLGTDHQDITNIEKVVFLGDSVTAGTPPTPAAQFYRHLLVGKLSAHFGALEVANCSAWGARTDDLLIGKRQIPQCFPGIEPKRTLVIMTVGGNDIAAWAQDGLSAQEAMVEADAAAQLLREGIEWFYEDPSRFPNGVFVIVGNPYEYTDATGDLLSCPSALLAGLSGNWIEGAPAVVHFQEQFMQIAVDTNTDVIFLLENFCGHGFRRGDPSSPCYLGPGTEGWFDLTCTHPNPTGHGVIADMFEATVLE